ncbi:hypothetical protein [Thermomonospora umbrina]|uniref:hypothetical protein n=1 Tax=Thermomonospora umbrina TaxID=111806 RepID=UPI001FE38DDC|nr:hypothetical protein [Thermomonospora umbrina]
MEETGGFLLLVDDVGELLLEGSEVAGGEADGGVVVFDHRFKLADVEVRRGAVAKLAASAEEVLVGGAVAVGGFLHDHAPGDAVGAASSAVEAAFEVVVVGAAALVGGGAGLDDLLHPLE